MLHFRVLGGVGCWRLRSRRLAARGGQDTLRGLGADARDGGEAGGDAGLASLGAVADDGEAVGFVADVLQ